MPPSWISGISLLGLATEVYLYGTPYIFTIVSLAVAGVLIRFILLPVFYNLQLTSTYEVSSMNSVPSSAHIRGKLLRYPFT